MPTDPSDEWGPTAGMTDEERMGYEMIRTLEGQLVTDDTFKDHTRRLDQTLKAMRRQLRYTRIACAAGALVLAALAVWGRASAIEAEHAAQVGQQVARCNEFRLTAVASSDIDPLAEAEGCDMRLARLIIDRGLETQTRNEKRLAELEAIARD